MQLCFFPQYIILFILGIYFYRKNLLLSIPYTTGIRWFKGTLILGIIFWFAMSTIADASEKGITPLMGGLNWGNAAYAFWESFFCVGVCLGLIVWFREKINQQGQISRFLSDNAFGVYVFHTPILVLISFIMKDVVLYPFFKYLLVAIITIPLCFGVSHILRKIPGVSTIIK
jgi:surface polysaccharide O-acyltransferase-like enzyme